MQYRGYTYALSHKKSKFVFDVQFQWGRHNYTCVFGSGWKTKHWNVGFTAAHAEERSKCSPCMNLSFCRRKLYVKLISHSKRRETCCDVLKSSRHSKSIREPSSARERIFTEHQEVRDHLRLRADEAADGEKTALSRKTLCSGISHKITSWGAKEPLIVRSMIWDEYAGIKNRKCGHDPPRIKQTNSCSPHRTLPRESDTWEFSERASLAPGRIAK